MPPSIVRLDQRRQLWEDAAVSYVGWGIDITNNGSAVSSSILRATVGGANRLTLDRDGNLYISGTIDGFAGSQNAQTGTTYETVAGDSGKIITLNNASPVTLTIHSGAPAGFNVLIVQKGAGQVTIAAGGTGAILNRSSHTKLAGQYAAATLFVESNAGTAPQCYLSGDTAA